MADHLTLSQKNNLLHHIRHASHSTRENSVQNINKNLRENKQKQAEKDRSFILQQLERLKNPKKTSLNVTINDTDKPTYNKNVDSEGKFSDRVYTGSEKSNKFNNAIESTEHHRRNILKDRIRQMKRIRKFPQKQTLTNLPYKTGYIIKNSETLNKKIKFDV